MNPSAPTVTASAPLMQDVRPVKAEIVAPIPVKAAPGSVPGTNQAVQNPVMAAKSPPPANEARTDKHFEKILKDVTQTVKDPNWMEEPPGRIKQNLHFHTILPIAVAFIVGVSLTALAVISFRPHIVPSHKVPISGSVVR